jgi:hypothetical protein
MFNADAYRVQEILNGARRYTHDPDVEVFALLVEIEGVEDPDVSSALERLVRDAYSN